MKGFALVLLLLCPPASSSICENLWPSSSLTRLSLTQRRDRLETLTLNIGLQLRNSTYQENSLILDIGSLAALLKSLPFDAAGDRRLFFKTFSVLSLLEVSGISEPLLFHFLKTQRDLLQHRDLIRRYILLDLSLSTQTLKGRVPFEVLATFPFTSFMTVLMSADQPHSHQSVAIEGLVALADPLLQAGLKADDWIESVPLDSDRLHLQSEIRAVLYNAMVNAAEEGVRIQAEQALLYVTTNHSDLTDSTDLWSYLERAARRH